MIVSHEHEFIFLKTRKTAGTSVEIALSAFCGDQDVITRLSPTTDEPERMRRTGRGQQNDAFPWRAYRAQDVARLAIRRRARRAYNHMPAPEVRALVGKKVFDRYHKIAITRSPFDVALSMYHYLGVEDRMSFAEFLRRPKFQEWYAGNHGIYSIADTVVADSLCRFTDLSSDMAEVGTAVGLPAALDLPHAKRTVDAGRARRAEMYRPEDVELVRRLCRREIESNGYDFDG